MGGAAETQGGRPPPSGPGTENKCPPPWAAKEVNPVLTPAAGQTRLGRRGSGAADSGFPGPGLFLLTWRRWHTALPWLPPQAPMCPPGHVRPCSPQAGLLQGGEEEGKGWGPVTVWRAPLGAEARCRKEESGRREGLQLGCRSGPVGFLGPLHPVVAALTWQQEA